MPHVNIKHFPAELGIEARAKLIAVLTDAIAGAFKCPPGVVSIALEPVAPEAWRDRVYAPEIQERAALLCKRPEY